MVHRDKFWRFAKCLLVLKDMNKKDDSLALLPNGFADLLPPYAEEEAKSIQALMDRFSAFGYCRVKPPLLEFEDSLLAPGPGERLANETFRLMDPVSHRMMGIRSDVTAQISRIVSSRLMNAARPLRLMYANDVLRTRGSQMRTERQFAQVGCELVGSEKGIEADVEICVLAVLGLKSVGIKDITLDMTIPGFVSSVLHEGEVENRDVIAKAVAQRDIDTLQALKCAKAQIIAQSMGASGGAEQAFSALKKIKFDSRMAGHVSRLQEVSVGVQNALSDMGIGDVSLTVDVLEQDGFEYHKALGFTLFSSNVRGELGRGGCYDIHFGQNETSEMATGFTLYMDTISQVSAPQPDCDKVFVKSSESWSVIADLQAQGWTVIRGVGRGDACQSCTHVYEHEKISKLVK